jgi:hypothetical protein
VVAVEVRRRRLEEEHRPLLAWTKQSYETATYSGCDACDMRYTRRGDTTLQTNIRKIALEATDAFIHSFIHRDTFIYACVNHLNFT